MGNDRFPKDEASKEQTVSNQADTGQRPTMSRRDALEKVGVAGAAAIITGGAASASQAAETTAGEIKAQNPYGGVPGGGITLPAYYRAHSLSCQQQHLL